MKLAKQAVPDDPEIPDAKVRELRANLIFEEALEAIAELGFDVLCGHNLVLEDHELLPNTKIIDISKVAKELADLSVVTIGSFVAFGLCDEPLLEAVDLNNLAKFGPGHTYRHDGKLIPPPGFKKQLDFEVIINA